MTAGISTVISQTYRHGVDFAAYTETFVSSQTSDPIYSLTRIDCHWVPFERVLISSLYILPLCCLVQSHQKWPQGLIANKLFLMTYS